MRGEAEMRKTRVCKNENIGLFQWNPFYPRYFTRFHFLGTENICSTQRMSGAIIFEVFKRPSILSPPPHSSVKNRDYVYKIKISYFIFLLESKLWSSISTNFFFFYLSCFNTQKKNFFYILMTTEFCITV